MRRWVPVGVLLSVWLARPALALPPIGAALPFLSVRSSDGRAQTTAPSDRPTLILYESRASRPQNYPLKTKLKVLAAESPQALQRLAFIPIANLEAYNFWPIRGIAAGTVSSEGTRLGHPIYVDWNGAVAKVLGARPTMSSVILADRSGTVIFASEGPLGQKEQEQVLELLRAELE